MWFRKKPSPAPPEPPKAIDIGEDLSPVDCLASLTKLGVSGGMVGSEMELRASGMTVKWKVWDGKLFHYGPSLKDAFMRCVILNTPSQLEAKDRDTIERIYKQLVAIQVANRIQ